MRTTSTTTASKCRSVQPGTNYLGDISVQATEEGERESFFSFFFESVVLYPVYIILSAPY